MSNTETKPWKDENRLRELYWGEGMTLEEVANEFGLQSGVTVLRWMDRFGIDRRPPSQGNTADLSDGAIEFIHGLLLGDGHLTKRKGGLSAQYEHTDSSYEYLEWLSSKLNKFGLKQSGSIRELPNGSFAYKTLSYRDLIPIRKRWYPTPNRKVPESIRVTPTMAKNWYIGDGCLMENGILISFLFSRNPNSHEDIREVLKPVSEIGVEYTFIKQGIRVRSRSVDDFLRYTLSESQEVPPGYSYKFPESVR